MDILISQAFEALYRFLVKIDAVSLMNDDVPRSILESNSTMEDLLMELNVQAAAALAQDMDATSHVDLLSRLKRIRMNAALLSNGFTDLADTISEVLDVAMRLETHELLTSLVYAKMSDQDRYIAETSIEHKYGVLRMG